MSAQLDRLNRRMAAIPPNVNQAVQPALAKSGEELVAEMKKLAEPSRRTGALIDSIEMTTAGNMTPAYSQPGGAQIVPDNTVLITAGNTQVRYAQFVEFGTAPHVNGGEFPGTENPGAPAQPFFFPAYRALKSKLQQGIKATIGNAVRSKWGLP